MYIYLHIYIYSISEKLSLSVISDQCYNLFYICVTLGRVSLSTNRKAMSHEFIRGIHPLP